MSRLITESDLATWAEARAIVISFCRSRRSGTCVIDVMDWIREPLALCQDQGICVLFGNVLGAMLGESLDTEVEPVPMDPGIAPSKAERMACRGWLAC